MPLLTVSKPSLDKRTLPNPYESPQLRKLTLEQGSLCLVPHAWYGDPDARELLEVLFPLAKA
jgi:hypothetical protein